jgi:hypothetical protein
MRGERAGSGARRAPQGRSVAGGLLLLTGLAACGEAAPVVRSAVTQRDLQPIELIGERTGLLVWRPVAGVTRYEVEMLGTGGAVRQVLRAGGDTLAPLPPNFMPWPSAAWRVRGYANDQAVAVSAPERIE